MSAVRSRLGCVPLMRAQGGGRIINISSRVGRQPDPYFAPYAAAKAALINFTKNLANAFSKRRHPLQLRRARAWSAPRQSKKRRARAPRRPGKTVEEVFAATLREAADSGRPPR